MAGRKMGNTTNKSIAAVVVIVFVASAFFLFRSVPEEVVGVSHDGLVRASGLTRSSESLVIERIDNIQTSVRNVVSPVYEVSLSEGGSLERGELTMVIDQSASLSDIVVYTFDRTTLGWIALPTLFDLSETTIFTSLDLVGSLLIVAGWRE